MASDQYEKAEKEWEILVSASPDIAAGLKTIIDTHSSVQ
jgi:hypothetical protein